LAEEQVGKREEIKGFEDEQADNEQVISHRAEFMREFTHMFTHEKDGDEVSEEVAGGQALECDAELV
jgi:hypothetical protein